MTLVRYQSDHHPLLLSVDFFNVKHASPFKCFKIWTAHEDCRKLVLDNCLKGVRGHGMARLQANYFW
jgi:hypothetical protein